MIHLCTRLPTADARDDGRGRGRHIRIAAQEIKLELGCHDNAETAPRERLYRPFQYGSRVGEERFAVVAVHAEHRLR